MVCLDRSVGTCVVCRPNNHTLHAHNMSPTADSDFPKNTLTKMTHCVHLDIRLRKWAHTHVYSGVWWSHQASVAISEMYALAFWIASPYHDNVHCDIPPCQHGTRYAHMDSWQSQQRVPLMRSSHTDYGTPCHVDDLSQPNNTQHARGSVDQAPNDNSILHTTHHWPLSSVSFAHTLDKHELQCKDMWSPTSSECCERFDARILEV